ncbi:hypothetical protein ABVT39_002233 [Epinephelus coioides]
MVQLEERDKEIQTQEEVTPTAPPPPIPPPPPYPQEPTQPAMGQYALRGSKVTEMEGQLEGRFTVTLTKNNEQGPNRRGLQGLRKKLKLETEPSSETESTDGLTSDEGDGEFTETETGQPPMIYKHCSRRSSDCTGTTARDTTDSASDEGSRSAEGQALTAGRKDRGKQKQVKNRSKAHHKSCSSLPMERSGSPAIELRKKKGKIEELKPRPMSTFGYEHWQQMLEWEAKNRQKREEEDRQRPATISPPPYPDPPTERGPHNGSDHSLQEHTPRGASLIDTQGQELLKELEGISWRTEGRLQQMSQLLETIQEQQLKEEGLQQEPEEPRASPATEHITLTLQGTMKSNKTQPKEVWDTNGQPTTDNRAQSQEGMRLRGGKVLGETEDLIYLYDEEGNRTTMCPLITQPNGQKQYEPWPFMDMIGLAERLPALTDGADKWIMALEETTAAIQLALGDVKVLLTYVAGKQITQEIFTEANVGLDWPLFSEHIVHHVELYRKDKKKKDEEDKQLVNKLTQLQLGELSKLVKKEKEKSKIQAPMVAVTQAAPPTIQPQAPLQPPPTDPNATGKETSTNATHHHYYYQQIPKEGTPHDCIHDTEKFMRAREDLQNQPIPADLTLFVDGSCFRDATGSHAGYGIIQLKNDDQTFDTLQAPRGNKIEHWLSNATHTNTSQEAERLIQYSTSDDTMATATDTPAAAVPFVITFGYKNFRQDGTNKRSADCKVCGINIKDAGSTTSNFIRHLKTHPDRSVTLAVSG